MKLAVLMKNRKNNSPMADFSTQAHSHNDLSRFHSRNKSVVPQSTINPPIIKNQISVMGSPIGNNSKQKSTIYFTDNYDKMNTNK